MTATAVLRSGDTCMRQKEEEEKEKEEDADVGSSSTSQEFR